MSDPKILKERKFLKNYLSFVEIEKIRTQTMIGLIENLEGHYEEILAAIRKELEIIDELKD